jgi:UDP:flavonoid glycosyltransferase YjiC (YdhE family)
MRVLFTPMAWPTHFYQMAGLAWACRAAGHEVRVAGHPNLVPPVTRTGMTIVPVGGGYDLIAGLAELVNMGRELARQAGVESLRELAPDALAQLQARRLEPHILAAEDVAADLVGFARWWRPDVVVSDPVVYAAPAAAGAVGAPLVRHLLGVDFARRVMLPGNGVGADEDPRAAWPAEFVDLYARYGAKPQADVAVCTVDTCPASMQYPGVPNRVPMRYLPFNGAGTVPAWLMEPPARPRVCVTWGFGTTAVLGPGAMLVPQVLRGLCGLDVEVVVAVGAADRAQLGEVPEQVRVVESMPLDMILPTCAAIVHQGGAGTALTAAYHGVPQVTVPLIADQGLVSERLVATGAAAAVDGERCDPAEVEAAVSAVVTGDGPRAAAHALRQEILAQPSPAQTVAVLEELA